MQGGGLASDNDRMTSREDRLGVFCLEGEWEPEDPHARQSVRPMLDLLEDQKLIRFFHRDVATYAELRHYLDRWTSGGLDEFSFGYLGFHGEPAALHLNDDERPDSVISLEQLGTDLADGCKGRVIHFAACSVVDVARSQLAEFRATTGARAVSGYRRDIAWVESAALDLLYLSFVAGGKIRRIDVAVRKLLENNQALADHLGFMIEA